MSIFEINFEDWKLNISINVLIIVIIIILFIIKLIISNRKMKNLKVKEHKINIGGLETTIEYDYMDREIAYKSWVEMNTRKIGLEIDEENDVIVEVYNSWYKFFGIIRENVKNLPVNKFKSSVNLINVIMDILNLHMRGHLTKWQAKFRRWYDKEINDNKNDNLSPQEIQRKYPKYQELINDLKNTSLVLIQLKEELYKLAFNKIK